MFKKKIAIALLGLMSTLITGLVLSTVAMAWFGGLSSRTEKEALNGEIGLRGYFYAGDGTPQKPFEIVTPTHFYNLTRLQNLGIFPEQKYFQVGHQFEPGVYGCIDGTDNEGNPNIVQYLDMSDISNSSTKLLPIGGEGAPFVGDFDGHGIPIKNLKISGYPEDIGVFGYVAHEGRVKGLVCDNLEIVSLGYNNTSGDADNELFGADIDDIFDANSHYFATQTKLDFYRKAGDSYTKYELKKLNGASGTSFNNIDASENLDNGRYFQGYFQPTYPSVANDRFTYGWKSSSKILKLVNNRIVMDLQALDDSNDFNSGADMQVDARLSLIASVEIEGFVYSRVIQSYVCEFHSNNATEFGQGNYSVSIFCDYAEQEGDTGRNTHYHHGVNIGFLAGHVDGTIVESYVYGGKLKFNETNYHAINTESQTGLVGEIGTNVVNEIEADVSQSEHGDTGIMNFSKIYSMIRGNMVSGQTINGGKRAIIGSTDYKAYVSYSNYINNESFDKFSNFLRKSDSNPVEYITSTAVDNISGSGAWHSVTVPNSVPDSFNSVDFLWNNVIEDEDLIDRGMGVFKVVTSKNDDAVAAMNAGNYGDYMVANIGESRIVTTTPKSKVYFSTAEWSKEKGGGDFNAARQTTIPSYTDALSFEYPFSRDFNYCFELDLSQMESAGGKDYMYNTDSDFLAGYLSTVLRDKRGDSIAPGNPRFGFMFRSSENEQLTSLSSYMPLGSPGTKAQYGVDKEGNPRYYPANSIVFRIDNEHGANVSVVANGSDAAIYKFDPTTSSESGTHKTEKILQMKNSGGNVEDLHRYFTYDVSTGATGDTAVIPASGNMSDGGSALYGHIFYLPQGDYVIGSSSGTTNIYFLAAQGQTDASIGADDVEDIGTAITDVDFLTEAPTYADYVINATHSGLKLALFSFETTHNMVSGTFIVQTATKNNKKYIHLTFGAGFVTYLYTYSRHIDHTYKIIDTWVERDRYEYPNPLLTP